MRKRGEKIERNIALKGKYGILAVETEPFLEGTVYVDGKKAGTSPDQFRLLEGEHEIRVEGIYNGKKLACVKKLTVKEHDDIEVRLVLKPGIYLCGKQWCWDWKGSYSSSAQTDPTEPSSGNSRVLRGGFRVVRAAPRRL